MRLEGGAAAAAGGRWGGPRLRPTVGFSGAWRARRSLAIISLLLLAGCASAPQRKADVLAATPGTVAAERTQAQPGTRYAEPAAAAALAQAIDARLAVMGDVAAAKWLAGAPIVDPVREAAVLDAVAHEADLFGLDPASVRAFFGQQVAIARELQQRSQDAWRREGRCDPCASALPLAESRSRIDSANRAQLQALYILAPIADGETHELAGALRLIAGRYGLGEDQRQALERALLQVRRAAPVQVDATLARIRATRTLRIGTSGDYAPFSRTQGVAELAGADIELGAALARALGVDAAFVRTSWPGLAQDLQSGRFDVALGGISITPERAAIGAFSVPYQSGGKTVVGRCAQQQRFDTLIELDLPSVRVVVNPGGTNERYVRQHLPHAQVIVHQDNRTVFDEILAGRADLMITDDVEADLQALRHRGELCRTMPTTLTQADKAILLQRDPALKVAVDAWLGAALARGDPQRALAAAMAAFAEVPRD
ncbi:MAG: transporter substrate-binding domain-containing protein [Steroidobacteraceae bacterium]